MPPTLQELGIDKLSIAERISLVQEIWDSIAAEIERSPLTESQRQEVDRRRPLEILAMEKRKKESLLPHSSNHVESAVYAHHVRYTRATACASCHRRDVRPQSPNMDDIVVTRSPLDKSS